MRSSGLIHHFRCAPYAAMFTLFLFILSFLCAVPCLGETADEPVYVENAWNFVDGAMEVTDGIPEDALGVLGDIREAGKLRVATEPYFPPQEFIDPSLSGQDQYVGADMDMARYIADKMQVELEIVPMEFTEVLTAVADSECDLAISALAFTPGRASMVELSKGYFYADEPTGCCLIIRMTDAESITSVDDLADKVIAGQSGSIQEVLIAENVTKYKEFVRVSSIQHVYEAVTGGQADVGAADYQTALTYIKEHPDCGLTVVPDIRFQIDEQFEGDRIAGKKGELQLMYYVNGIINELTEANQYNKWYREAETYASSLR